MKIQSLSIVVPNKRCVNNCRFCVSKMHADSHLNQMDANLPFYDLYEKDYIKRLEFARDNGCNTVMLTGNSEPQQNRNFLQKFGTMNSNLKTPFRWVEMQTTGVMLDEQYLRFLRNHVGVSTISLSISSFCDEENKLLMGTNPMLYNRISTICGMIKKYDFNLRISINLSSRFNFLSPEEIFHHCHRLLGADQVTFRVLYAGNLDSPQAEWVRQNSASKEKVEQIQRYIKEKGRLLEKLEIGYDKYSVHEMGVVVDRDCMSQEAGDSLKYLVLQPNCKLYTKWDDPASLLF